MQQVGLERLTLAVRTDVLNQSLSLPQLEAMRLILGRIEPVRIRMAMAEFLRSLKLSEDQTRYSYFAPGDRTASWNRFGSRMRRSEACSGPR